MSTLVNLGVNTKTIDELKTEKLYYFVLKASLRKGVALEFKEAEINTSSSITPCSGCDIVIDSCSTNKSRIVEYSNQMEINDYLTIFQHLTSIGYCTEANKDLVLSSFHDVAKTMIDNYRIQLLEIVKTATELQIELTEKYLMS